MKTFGCNPSVDAFARFYELVIIPEVVKGSDGQFYHSQHACCTFNTRRQNTDDWSSHWFYLKVNMPELSCPIAPLTAVNVAEIN
jgi:hypothetical protein